jgi:MerR family transcriptional regulator, light-induced transcriptional regulator
MYQEFLGYLEMEDKKKCMDFAVGKLLNNEMDVGTLYEKILRPALNSMNTCLKTDPECIWREHIKTSIVRGIIESSYMFIVKELDGVDMKGKKVMVVCPENERHEIGARMVADFFTICGYESIFIGGSTPDDQIYSAISRKNPDYLALSVTDYYNLSAANRIITNVRQLFGDRVKIVVGGNAFRHNEEFACGCGADYYLDKLEDIRRIGGDRGGDAS